MPLTAQEMQDIHALAEDIPALWSAVTTTAAERKEILRLVIDRVVVKCEQGDEVLSVNIHWIGGVVTRGSVIRPVARMTQLSYYAELKAVVAHLVSAGRSAVQIADQLNEQGLRPAKRTKVWNAEQVRGMVRDFGLAISRSGMPQTTVARAWRRGDWWTVTGLAVTLGMPSVTLYTWLRRHDVQARKEGRQWWIWADDVEVSRLKTRRAKTRSEHAHDQWNAQKAVITGRVREESAYVRE